jgi:pimeloyl-ACP methyl ester carboxylesterase
VYGVNTPRKLIDEDLAVRMVHQTTVQGYNLQFSGAVGYAGTLNRLHEITVPVLLITGDSDILVNPENTNIIEKALTKAKFVKKEILPGASHILWTDDTQRTNKAIISFLQHLSSNTNN